MKLQNHTVLITGGSSGIGLELARQLVRKKNTVIICGRSAKKLSEAKEQIPEVETFPCDIAIETERRRLFEWILQHHPKCNILVNNAAIVHRANFLADDSITEKASAEINTNLLAPIALSKLFLNTFEKLSHSSIVNITTGLIYAPRAVYPIYNATKAGLHIFTQVLRHQLQQVPVKVVEVMMPVVSTPWHQGNVPQIAIAPEEAVTEMIRKLEKGNTEIKVGKVKLLYLISRISPKLAFRMINRL